MVENGPFQPHEFTGRIHPDTWMLVYWLSAEKIVSVYTFFELIYHWKALGVCFSMDVRQHSLYSLVHESRQDRSISVTSEEKEFKKKIHKSFFFFLVGHFFADVAHFSTKMLPIWKKKVYTFWHVGGKNKKNTQMSVFFFSSGIFSAHRRNRGPKNIVSVA